MIALPIITLVLTVAGALFAVHLRRKSYEASAEGAVALIPHVSLRLIPDVEAPDNIVEAAKAIDAVLTERYGAWWEKVELIIEWLPYGTVVRGPFIKTGFVARGEKTLAVLPPKPPITEETSKHIARVVGTIRIDKAWPWSSFKRFTVVIMDGRTGTTKREVLAGEGRDKPRMGVEKTALFYEIAWRLVPLCLEGKLANEIPSTGQDSAHKAIEAEMQTAFKNFRAEAT